MWYFFLKILKDLILSHFNNGFTTYESAFTNVYVPCRPCLYSGRYPEGEEEEEEGGTMAIRR